MRSITLALLLCTVAAAPLLTGSSPASAQLVERSPSQALGPIAARLATARTTVEAASPGQLQQAVAAEVLANPGNAPDIVSALTDVVTGPQLQGARRGALDGIGAAVQRGRITSAVGQRLSSSIGARPPGQGQGSFPPMQSGRGGGYLN